MNAEIVVVKIRLTAAQHLVSHLLERGRMFALGSGSSNNQDVSQIFSTNENQMVSKEIQENGNCVDESFCSNGLHNSMGIGAVGSSIILSTSAVG